MQSDLKLGLLTGSRAKTDAWLFSAMLFPFCLAGSQEEQGLECEPFGGGLRPPLLGCLLVQGWQVLPSPGRGLRTYLVHRWLGSTWNSPIAGRVKATLLWGTGLVTSHPSPFGTGEHRASAVGDMGGLFPQEHGLGSQSERFCVPTGTNTYVGAWGTSQEPGTGAACPALGHGLTAPAISLGGVTGATNKQT